MRVNPLRRKSPVSALVWLPKIADPSPIEITKRFKKESQRGTEDDEIVH